MDTEPGNHTAEFTKSLVVREKFTDVLSPKNYQSLPDDWLIAVTDVVASREAIWAGRFKPVNMAGVAMISAIMNALGDQDIPYIFGGDGAALACAPAQRELIETALAKTVAWVEDELTLELRAALVPLADIEKAGSQVRVAAVKISPAIINFAFIGGGVAAAEKLMKQGNYRIERAKGADYPDLTGLSCRWTPIEQKGSKIISLIVEPVEGSTHVPAPLMHKILELVRADTAKGHPVPKGGPFVTWPPAGLELEARARRGRESLFRTKLYLYVFTLVSWFLFKTGKHYGDFDPVRYRDFTARNTDYRKIQDGIRMTVCLERNAVENLRAYLKAQHAKGKLHYGLSEQDQAVLTCYVPSTTSDDHYHFLDGAGGGYAAAADAMK